MVLAAPLYRKPCLGKSSGRATKMKVKFYRAFFGVLSNPGAGTCRFGLGFGGGGGGGGGAGFAPESLSLICITSFSGW